MTAGPLSRLPRRVLSLMFSASLGACLSTLISCGGGGDSAATVNGSASGAGSGSTASGANVVPVVVDAGPNPSSPDVNTLFTTVTVCAPGSTTNCQTIDHIQVDTESYGLRLLASALTIGLPVSSAGNSQSLVECAQFVDGYSWGPVALADVHIEGEIARSVPVQVIGNANFTAVPPDCSSIGPAEDTVAAFGANGILGVGVFAQDCGSACADAAQAASYYGCSSTQCQAVAVALSSQVTNPVTFFATDNNGVVIQLPAVAAQGAATVTGSLIFGIDTQSNNKSGNQTVLTLDPLQGYLTTVFDGQTLAQSFFDTGSNGFYFNVPSSNTTLPRCQGTNAGSFYCPPIAQNLTAVVEGQNGISVNLNFTVANADTLGANDPTFVAFSTLAGPYPGTTASFDWGLPFYFGRTVYTAMAGAATSVGTGPYVAF